MRVFNKLISYAALVLLSHFSHAESAPAQDLGKMVKSMYSYSVDMFEYGEFDGRRNDKKSCAQAQQFFYGPILKDLGTPNCRYKHSRFPPDITGTPVEQLVNENNDLPPIPFIQSIKVKDEQAQIDILFGAADAPKGKAPDIHKNNGRVVFFWKKLPQGWRIVNKLSFRKWPLKLDGENSDCRLASIDFQFAIEPRTESDLAYLPPECQKLLRPQLPR
jgi:hypothetical protein